jgi:ADP-L-glycero-D-manno-heptose 6-epimerase
MIIITGGAGFIGSNLVTALYKAGEYDVVVCDRMDHPHKWENLATAEIADFVYPDDLFDFIDRYAAQITTIFHLGGITNTSANDPETVTLNNFGLSRNLWDWCCKRGTRLIYASDASTYGMGEAGWDDGFDSANLKQLHPRTLYSWSKHLFDQRVARQLTSRREKPTQYVGLKFFSVYGPHEDHKANNRSMVRQMIEQVDQQGRVQLFKSAQSTCADGEQKRDFIHVEDATDVMLWFWQNAEVNGLFNVGSGQARSFNQLAAVVFGAMERGAPQINYFDMPPAFRNTYQPFAEAKLDRLRAAGYTGSFRPLEQGVPEYLAWLRHK